MNGDERKQRVEQDFRAAQNLARTLASVKEVATEGNGRVGAGKKEAPDLKYVAAWAKGRKRQH